MVRGFAMESQDKRMCKTESAFSGVTIDYNHRTYDDDCFGDMLNMFDFPMESLEGDGLAEDWASKLGPIPSELFKELVPPGSHIGVGNSFGGSTDLPFEHPVSNMRTSQLKYQQNHVEEPFKDYQIGRISQLKQEPVFVEDKKLYHSQASPNSVLESGNSSSNNKGISFGMETSVPVRTRSKRLRPITNSWLLSPLIVLPNKDKKRRKPFQVPIHLDPKISLDRSNVVGIKKCAHCDITKTPQWREGPMGPKTLCNACGVRYRSGRLYPEYRPAASPTFVPALHSNSHRKVIEINPWLLSPPIVLPNKDKKRRKLSQVPIHLDPKISLDRSNVVGIKKCAHCEITKTPQWREGPMGPKTLCNACGVRYRSGRLYPEYRPAASPTFVPALHSNSHRKVIEMRQKAVK